MIGSLFLPKKIKTKENMRIFWADATIFLKIFFFFCTQKVEKTTLKTYLKIHKKVFTLTWSKHKNPCSKMCFIDQLYIKPGQPPLFNNSTENKASYQSTWDFLLWLKKRWTIVCWPTYLLETFKLKICISVSILKIIFYPSKLCIIQRSNQRPY